MKNIFISIVFFLTVLLTGCRFTNSLDEAESTLKTLRKEVIEGRLELQEFTSEMNKFLENAPEEVRKILRDEVTSITQNAVANAGSEMRCNAGILKDHMASMADRMIEKLRGNVPKTPNPVICNSSLQIIDSKARPTAITLYGAGLPNLWEHAKIYLYKEGEQQPLIIEDKNLIGQLNAYQFTINLNHRSISNLYEFDILEVRVAEAISPRVAISSAPPPFIPLFRYSDTCCRENGGILGGGVVENERITAIEVGLGNHIDFISFLYNDGTSRISSASVVSSNTKSSQPIGSKELILAAHWNRYTPNNDRWTHAVKFWIYDPVRDIVRTETFGPHNIGGHGAYLIADSGFEIMSPKGFIGNAQLGIGFNLRELNPNNESTNKAKLKLKEIEAEIKSAVGLGAKEIFTHEDKKDVKHHYH